MNNNRLIAVFVATVFVIVAVSAGAYASDATDDSSATNYGTFKFWIYEADSSNATTVTTITGTGYNAAEALKDACSTNNMSLVFATIDGVSAEDYTYTVYEEYYSYDTINANYGTVSTIDDTTVSSIWCFNYDGNSNGQWAEARSELGFYRPYDDYNVTFATANIAIVLSGATYSEPTGDIQALVDVPTDAEDAGTDTTFAVTFHLYLGTDGTYGNPTEEIIEDLSDADGITVVGYGSDAYTALKNAIVSVVGYDDVTYTYAGKEYISTMYGYVEDIYDLQYYMTEDYHYYYWSTYEGGSTMVYCDYMLGYYSPLSIVPESTTLNVSEFTLVYVYS